MDVRLSPEQEALRDSAAKLVADLGPATVADLDDRGRVAKLDAAVAGAGWRELRTATDAGAPWASAVDVALVAEELGRGLADTLATYKQVRHVVFVDAVPRLPSGKALRRQLRDEWVPALAGGTAG